MAFVNSRTSPARAPTFRQTRCGLIMPVDRVAELNIVVANRVAANDAAFRFRHFSKDHHE